MWAERVHQPSFQEKKRCQFDEGLNILEKPLKRLRIGDDSVPTPILTKVRIPKTDTKLPTGIPTAPETPRSLATIPEENASEEPVTMCFPTSIEYPEDYLPPNTNNHTTINSTQASKKQRHGSKEEDLDVEDEEGFFEGDRNNADSSKTPSLSMHSDTDDNDEDDEDDNGPSLYKAQNRNGTSYRLMLPENFSKVPTIVLEDSSWSSVPPKTLNPNLHALFEPEASKYNALVPWNPPDKTIRHLLSYPRGGSTIVSIQEGGHTTLNLGTGAVGGVGGDSSRMDIEMTGGTNNGEIMNSDEYINNLEEYQDEEDTMEE